MKLTQFSKSITGAGDPEHFLYSDGKSVKSAPIDHNLCHPRVKNKKITLINKNKARRHRDGP